MKSGLQFVKSKAILSNQAGINGTVILNGVSILFLNGEPRVDGSLSFNALAQQVNVWVEFDGASLTSTIADPDAAKFFVDKSSANNQIHIFYADDLAKKKC